MGGAQVEETFLQRRHILSACTVDGVQVKNVTFLILDSGQVQYKRHNLAHSSGASINDTSFVAYNCKPSFF